MCPEIWSQTDGKVDGFTCAVGSGGTLAGVTMALKERNKSVVCALSDPGGAALYGYYKDGELKSEGTSITEGIGQGRITANLEGLELDSAFRIHDSDALEALFDLTINEGMCLGGSAGINIAGAMALAKEMGPGKTIVTMLCDYGNRYQSKLYNPEFLREKGLPIPSWLDTSPMAYTPPSGQERQQPSHSTTVPPLTTTHIPITILNPPPTSSSRVGVSLVLFRTQRPS